MDIFELTGGYIARPASQAAADASSSVARNLAESLLLQNKEAGTRYDLTSDAPVPVAFGACGAAHVVVIQTTGSVVARLTSSAGATQAIPVGPLAVILSADTPFTAIDLTRPAGVETTVQVFLGEKV